MVSVKSKLGLISQKILFFLANPWLPTRQMGLLPESLWRKKKMEEKYWYFVGNLLLFYNFTECIFQNIKILLDWL